MPTPALRRGGVAVQRHLVEEEFTEPSMEARAGRTSNSAVCSLRSSSAIPKSEQLWVVLGLCNSKLFIEPLTGVKPGTAKQVVATVCKPSRLWMRISGLRWALGEPSCTRRPGEISGRNERLWEALRPSTMSQTAGGPPQARGAPGRTTPGASRTPSSGPRTCAPESLCSPGPPPL